MKTQQRGTVSPEGLVDRPVEQDKMGPDFTRTCLQVPLQNQWQTKINFIETSIFVKGDSTHFKR